MSDQTLPRPEAKKRGLPQFNSVYVLVVARSLPSYHEPRFGEPTGYMNFLKRVRPSPFFRAVRSMSSFRAGSISASARS